MAIRLIEHKDIEEMLLEVEFDFATTVSFESRCIGSVASLRKSGVMPASLELYDYSTVAEPKWKDVELRALHRSRIVTTFANGLDLFHIDKINPYSTTGLRKCSDELIARNPGRALVVDITCMSRVHLLSFASSIAQNGSSREKIIICYSAPESYGFTEGNKSGWVDTILVPIGHPRLFRREGHSRGIVLAGHDGERLSLALSELEPGSGSFIFSKTAGRPDIMQKAREANASVSERLLSMKMPRSKPSLFEASDSWAEVRLELVDFIELQKIIALEISRAKIDRGPLVLYPFGPKTLSFAAALQLATYQSDNAWAVYPIPDCYMVNYSRGSLQLHWMVVEPM